MEINLEKNFTILKYDKEFINPKIKLTAELELIRIKILYGGIIN